MLVYEYYFVLNRYCNIYRICLSQIHYIKDPLKYECIVAILRYNSSSKEKEKQKTRK